MNGACRDKRFISAAAMADRLGVRASAVRRWAWRGLIPKLVLPNGRLVFDPARVIAELEQHQKRPASGVEGHP